MLPTKTGGNQQQKRERRRKREKKKGGVGLAKTKRGHNYSTTGQKRTKIKDGELSREEMRGGRLDSQVQKKKTKGQYRTGIYLIRVPAGNDKDGFVGTGGKSSKTKKKKASRPHGERRTSIPDTHKGVGPQRNQNQLSNEGKKKKPTKIKNQEGTGSKGVEVVVPL